jgi:hypothetical protein
MDMLNRTGTTTIRIYAATKKELEKLDFVQKHSYNDIILELIKAYQESRK